MEEKATRQGPVGVSLGGWHLQRSTGTDERLCALVVIGVNPLGKKHFLAIENGMRGSVQSWKDVLQDLQDRGLIAPKSYAEKKCTREDCQ